MSKDLWKKIKQVSYLVFDRYAQYIAASSYIFTCLNEYWMGFFDLAQLVIYGGVPCLIFSTFYIQGIKRGGEQAEFHGYVSHFKEMHENIMRQIFQKNNELSGQVKLSEHKPEIH
jgi:hypothetical protein